jgi:hypothetical protein
MDDFKNWSAERQADEIDIVAASFPYEMAMYHAYGCEHPYSKGGLGDAIRLVQWDYVQMVREVLTEGEWPDVNSKCLR